jgi:hypothetical protein
MIQNLQNALAFSIDSVDRTKDGVSVKGDKENTDMTFMTITNLTGTIKIPV